MSAKIERVVWQGYSAILFYKLINEHRAQAAASCLQSAPSLSGKELLHAPSRPIH